MSIRVSGASDDLIEVDGDIYEEFNPSYGGEEDSLLGFSNGVLLRVRYDEDGVWRITPLKGTDKVTIVQAPAADDENYTDVATVESANWVVYGTTWAGPK